MTNRVSGLVGFAAADLVAAIPGPPFRKTDAGLTCSSAQATRTPLVNRSETATPYCRPRFMSCPRTAHLDWETIGLNGLTPQIAARLKGSGRSGQKSQILQSRLPRIAL